ncbi:MAG: anhydro-N-acetylmuramic acid kinase [candidate division Zixibacteria bacterium]|nr:anhydro-N-acetylmuramic acid kinase [candidate division Zixibacteria bacterium]
MSLERIARKRALNVLGLNSGTSADALDMAAVRITRSRGIVRVTKLAVAGKRIGQQMQELVFQVADSKATTTDQIILLDNLLGKFIGRAAAAFIRKLARDGIAIDMTASHGQTVRHLPKKTRFGGQWVNGSLQLGSIDMIAAQTGKITVGDFRQADIALGNEGAPITTGAMRRMFSSGGESRLIVNIGGISNYFYFPKPKSGLPTSAADCGPGNSLSDILSMRLFGERCDRSGRRAASGTLSNRLLSLLLGDPFFTGKALSTGRETFGCEMAERIIEFGRRFKLRKEDLLRTTVELTTNAIAIKIWPFVRRDTGLTRLYLTGGGRRNRFLVKRLGQHLPDLDIRSIDEFGLHADYVEAAAYAVMGEACLRSESLPVSSGMFRGEPAPVLGRIAQPPMVGPQIKVSMRVTD